MASESPGHAQKELRKDPDSGKIWNFQDFKVHFANEFSAKEVESYWRNACIVVKEDLPQGDPDSNELRRDPDTGKVWRFEDFQENFDETFNAKDVAAYWRDACLVVSADEAANEGFNGNEPAKGSVQHDEGVACSSTNAAESAETQLRIGNLVRLVGLKKAIHLNGSRGHLESFDPENFRWRAILANGERKDIRPDNLIIETADIRIDPDSKEAFTYEELNEKFKSEFSAEDLQRYWDDVCVEMVDEVEEESDHEVPDDEEGTDPESSKVVTFAEMKERYKDQYSADELRDYWKEHYRDALGPVDVERMYATMDTKQTFANMNLDTPMRQMSFDTYMSLGLGGEPMHMRCLGGWDDQERTSHMLAWDEEKWPQEQWTEEWDQEDITDEKEQEGGWVEDLDVSDHEEPKDATNEEAAKPSVKNDEDLDVSDHEEPKDDANEEAAKPSVKNELPTTFEASD